MRRAALIGHLVISPCMVGPVPGLLPRVCPTPVRTGDARPGARPLDAPEGL